MKKNNSTLFTLRKANSNPEAKKQDHFSYFQNLEHKLLLESEKLTSLIGVKSLSATETDSPQSSCILNSKNSEPSLFSSNVPFQGMPQGVKMQRKASEVIRAYIQKRNKYSTHATKSQNLFGREREGQLQRKLTYNMVRPQQQTPLPQVSPNKSDRIAQCLKTTASTTCSNSSLLRTIDKIKRMNSNHTLPPPPPKPISIEDFQIIKYLQEGQFGTVYLSRHLPTNFICALKRIPKRLFEGDMRFIGQLIREIKIQSYLDHPNIAQLYCCFSDEENLYLMLQVCCGGNVYNILKREGRFSQDRVRSIIRQLCFAIEYMHDSDIIHRDIKPENILLHEDIVKVCDFGWSIHSPLLRDTRCGTPLYSSPQVIQKQQYDNKIDVWNIGILAYELLYGRVPFEIRTEDDLVKVVDQNIYFPKSIPVTCEAKDFILKCLIKNPKERLATAKLVDHEFIHNH